MNQDREATANTEPVTVTIGILTCRRPDGLALCIDSVLDAIDDPAVEPSPRWQVTEILVVDNDPEQSARPIVTGPGQDGRLRYVNEPVPGIAVARNRALDDANGHILLFIDDDEVAAEGWPHGVIDTMIDTGAALVGGPVETVFTEPPPAWITEGGFFDRPNHPDQSPQIWLRSGNLAIDRATVAAHGIRFDPSFKQGSDGSFSRHAHQLGLDLRWSATGTVRELVNPDRFTPTWRLDRERVATKAWGRIELDHAEPGIGRIGVAAVGLLKALIKSGRGTVATAWGLVRRNQAAAMAGRVEMAQARGRLEAVLDTNLTSR